MRITTLVSISIALLSEFQINGYVVSKDAPVIQKKAYENPDLFEGDMLFPPSLTGRGVALRGSGVTWTNGTVPYEILSGYALVQESFIISTMQRMKRLLSLNNVACIQFRRRISSDQYYITIVNGYGCSAYVGQNTGVTMNRTVTLQYPECIDDARIMYELLHVLGFYHGQSRSDRDSYVRVNYGNIQAGMASNFDKYSISYVDTQNTSYDYASVMHYERDAFSSNGLPTIEPLQANISIGQRYNMSTTDILEVRLLYNCSPSGFTLPPIPTTTTANLFVINTTVSSSWTTTDSKYTRFNSSGSNYYYHAYFISVPVTGYYVIMSESSLDTFVYIYSSTFYPSYAYYNLIAYDDDSRGNGQFQLTMNFPDNTIYILIMTSHNQYTTGSYKIIVSGLNTVNLARSYTSTVASTSGITTTYSIGATFVLSLFMLLLISKWNI